MKNIRKIWLLFLITFVVQSKLFAADKVVDSLSRMLKTANADSTRIDIHAQLSNLLLSTDYKQSLMHATSAVRLAEKLDEYSRKIKAYKVAGAVCMYMGLNDLSVNYYTKYYKLAESKNDQSEMGAASFNLASVQIALTDYRKAREALLKAGDLLNEAYKQKGQLLPDPILLMYRMNLSTIYTNLGELERSDSILSLTFPMVKGVRGLEDKLQSVYHIQCQLFISKKEFDKALIAISDARALANKRGDIAGRTATYFSSGQIYQEKGDNISAIREYREGYRSAEAIGGITLQSMMAESLYKLYQKAGNSDSSIKYFNLFTSLKEKSKNEEAKSTLMREELLKEYKKLEVELNEKNISEKRSYLYAAILALLFAAIGILGTIGYSRRYRRLQLDQVSKDLQAQRIALEKERLELQVADKDKQLSELEYRASKNAMLETLVTELQSIYAVDSKTQTITSQKQETSKLVQQGKIWEEFEVRFAKTHGDFYDRLVKAFPDITLNERRLCAFLKLDMTTKEISTITGQSVRAIEIARTRLRKKLNLSQTDTSLFEFLSSI